MEGGTTDSTTHDTTGSTTHGTAMIGGKQDGKNLYFTF